MNEIVRLTRFDAAGSVVGEEQHTQDSNGNRIQEADYRLFWDSFDRLVRVERASDGVVVGRYRYDALGRRVDRSLVAQGEVASQQVFHVHDGAREVEELDAAGNVLADFVWGGMYVDELVQLRRGGQTYYAHSSSIYSVAALSDAGGSVVERYAYRSIYGVCQVQDGAGAPKSAAAEVGNPWRFQGRRFDPETGFSYFRARQMDPARGRFVSRDPLGLWGDPGQAGNSYTFAGNDPVNGVDPWGLTGGEMVAAGGGAAKITLEAVLQKLAERGLAALTAEELALYEAAQAAQAAEAAAAQQAAQQAGKAGAAAGGTVVAGAAALGAIVVAGSDIAESWTKEMMIRAEEESALAMQDTAAHARQTDWLMQQVKSRGGTVSAGMITAFHAALQANPTDLRGALNAALAMGARVSHETVTEFGITEHEITVSGTGIDFQATLRPGGVLYIDWAETGMHAGLRATINYVQSNPELGTINVIEGFATDKLLGGFDPGRFRRGVERELPTWNVTITDEGGRKWIRLTPRPTAGPCD